jgi:hypothetical protein
VVAEELGVSGVESVISLENVGGREASTYLRWPQAQMAQSTGFTGRESFWARGPRVNLPGIGPAPSSINRIPCWAMVRLVSWNMARRVAAWAALRDVGADVALVQEAGRPAWNGPTL